MNLNKIISNYSDDVQAVVHGDEDLSNYPDLFEALFTHYCDSSEMPYGTASAKDGDPYEWITNKLKELVV